MYAGSRKLEINDESNGLAFSAHVLYPTETPSEPTQIGRFIFNVATDAPIAQGSFPLVIVSHGGGGSHVGYRTITQHLARSGYIVAALKHPGDNFEDQSLSDTLENLENRPRHVGLTIDAVAADSEFAGVVQSDNVAVIGHSMGGYTALALAGGIPWAREGQQVAVTPDPRVRALVLFAPAGAFYQAEGALNSVSVPILMYAAEHDTITPRWQHELILNSVADPGKVDFRVVENAGHLSFLSPYPEEYIKKGFFPAVDPDGFNREAFHKVLPGEILEFLNANL